MELNSNNIPELQSPFEQLREVDADGKEWWNSRKLARVMGYDFLAFTTENGRVIWSDSTHNKLPPRPNRTKW